MRSLLDGEEEEGVFSPSPVLDWNHEEGILRAWSLLVEWMKG